MGLMEQIKIDVQTFTSNKDDFGVDLIFFTPSNEQFAIAGYYSDHSTVFNEMGEPVTGQKISVVISEQSLIDAGYPSVRTSENLISMVGHRAKIAYANGDFTKYIIDECRPDYTISLITLFMASYVED